MKRIKEFLAFILCVSLVGLPFGFSAETETTAEDSVPQWELLKTLGTEILDSESTVTRGQFVTSFMSLMNFDLNIFERSSFQDVDVKNRELVSAIEYAVGMNAVSSGEYFYPEREISYAEACKIAVSVLGYDNDAKRYGGYPSGYVAVASLLELDKGKVSSDVFTARDMYVMFENILDTKVKVITSCGAEGNVTSYTMEANETFLEAYHDIVKVKGVVTAANGGYLYDSTAEFRDNRVIIGETEYRLAENVICPLGYYVTAYAQEDPQQMDDMAEVIYADLGRNEVTNIAAADLVSFSDKTLSYIDESNAKQSIALENDTLVLYNGRACESYQNTDIMIDAGYLEAIDNNRDGGVDVLSVWSAVYLEVDYVNRYSDTYDYVFYDKNKQNTISLDADKMNFLCNVKLNGIKSGDVLEVFLSKKKDFVKIQLLNHIVSGTLNGIETNNSIAIGENEIETTSYFETFYSKELSVGESTSVALDSSGRAVAVVSSATGFMKMAYFDNTNVKGGVGEDILLKLFTEDGEVITPKLADKVQINGKRESRKDAYTKLVGAKGELIRYHLDSEEQLDRVNTVLADEGTYDAAADGANTLKRYRFENDDTENTIYYKSFGYFVPYFTLNENTKIFCISTNETEDAKRFTIGNLSFLSNDKKVPSNMIKPYNTDVNGLTGALLYVSDDAAAQSLSITSSSAVVAKMSTAIDTEGEKVFKIRLYANDKYTTLYIKKDASFIQAMRLQENEYPFAVGDLIRYSADEKGGYMLTAVKDFDYKTKTLLYDAEDNRELHYYYGQIYAIGESSVAVKKSDDSIIYIPLSIGDAGMIENGDVLTQPKEKIASYIQVGEECHKILIRCRYSSPNQYYIYK